MKKTRKLLSALMVIIMFIMSSGVSFAEEVKWTEFDLVDESSGVKIRIPDFIEVRDISADYGYEEGSFIAVFVKTPKQNSEGTYSIFELIDTEGKYERLGSFPGTYEGGQADYVEGEFVNNKLMYNLHVDPARFEEEVVLCGFWLEGTNAEGDMIFFDVDINFVFVDEDVKVEETDKPSNWAVAEVEKAKEYNLITDKVQSKYQQDITREELCELTVKLYEALSGKQASVPETNKFIDTDNVEILKANALGIVNGVNENEFAPNEKVTREQIAAMIYRTLQIVDSSLVSGESHEVTFADKGQIAKYALEAVGFMSKNEIIGGVGNNTMNPKGNTTREQGIAIIVRTFEKFK